MIRRQRWWLIVSSWLVLVLVLVACEDSTQLVEPADPNLTIYEFLSSDDNYSTLMSVINEAGADSLVAHEEVTIFAAPNLAFEEYEVSELLDDAGLRGIVEYHIVPGSIMQDDLHDGQFLQTLQGDSLRVRMTNDVVTIDGSEIISPDVTGPVNGVIHGIDDVLLGPLPAHAALRYTLETQTFFTYLTESGVHDELIAMDDFTILAPNEDAFASGDLPEAGSAEMRDILRYHVLEGTIRSSEIEDGQEVATAHGSPVTFAIIDGVITANDSIRLAATDREVAGGVIHQINGVLQP